MQSFDQVFRASVTLKKKERKDNKKTQTKRKQQRANQMEMEKQCRFINQMIQSLFFDFSLISVKQYFIFFLCNLTLNADMYNI